VQPAHLFRKLVTQTERPQAGSDGYAFAKVEAVPPSMSEERSGADLPGGARQRVYVLINYTGATGER
jgi:hypothetical protein